MFIFLTHLFEAWNQAGIRYLILRNYEELPEHTGNDIDVLLDPRQRRSALKVLSATATTDGWRIHNTAEFACFSVFLYHLETLEQIHIDLMCGIKWHALEYIEYNRLLCQRQPYKNFYIPHCADEAVVSLMTRLLYGGYIKEKYKEGIQRSAQRTRSEMIESLSPWVGNSLATGLVSRSADGDWKEIEHRCGSIRKRVLLANLKHPIRMGINLLKDGSRLLRRWVKPSGLSIVFFGPDGCGKTSVANGLKEALHKTFHPEKGMHCHWKPVHPRGEAKGPAVDPHGKPPRTPASSLLYFGYHYLPFLWGWWRYVKPVLFKNGLVIIDRYYYDFFVDLRRYRLNLPPWIIKLGYVFVKKPDLVFCLDADPEILQARKQEVSFEECKRQREAYRTLAEKLPNGHVIDASHPLDEVVRGVQSMILGFMANRSGI